MQPIDQILYILHYMQAKHKLLYVVNTKQPRHIIEQFMDEMRSGKDEIHRWTGGAVTAGLGWSCSRVQDIYLHSGHITPHTSSSQELEEKQCPSLSSFPPDRLLFHFSCPLLIAPSPPSLSAVLPSTYFKMDMLIRANSFTLGV